MIDQPDANSPICPDSVLHLRTELLVCSSMGVIEYARSTLKSVTAMRMPDLFRTISLSLFWTLVLLSAPISAQEARAAEYRLQAGDVLEFSVIGIPELQKRIVINIDGVASFTLLDDIHATGLTLAQLRQQVQALLPQRTFRYRMLDGREGLALIKGEEVLIDIAEYRPVYVKGDVAKPGELKYRPGMTLDQAIALAGGVELSRISMGNPLVLGADLRAEHEALTVEVARHDARLWRLQNELKGKTELVLNDAPPTVDGYTSSVETSFVPMPSRADLTEARKLEIDQFKVRRDDLAKERDFFTRAIKKAERHRQLLEAQQKREAEAVELDTKELETMVELQKKGTVSVPRITESRRAVLLSVTRVLQTNVQLAQVTREQESAGRGLEKLDDQRRMEILKEISDTNLLANRARARLEAVRSNLTYTMAAKSYLAGASGPKPEFFINRKDETGRSRFAAQEQTELLPGDVVEVIVKLDQLLSASVR
jgi:polysaccharide export outer membrane protein